MRRPGVCKGEMKLYWGTVERGIKEICIVCDPDIEREAMYLFAQLLKPLEKAQWSGAEGWDITTVKFKIGMFKKLEKKEKVIMDKYIECTISPHHAGFGMWDSTSNATESWSDPVDLLNECANNVGEIWELGAEELPDQIEDIRGSIYNQPDRVFAYLLTDGVEGDPEPGYFGISKIEA